MTFFSTFISPSFGFIPLPCLKRFWVAIGTIAVIVSPFQVTLQHITSLMFLYFEIATRATMQNKKSKTQAIVPSTTTDSEHTDFSSFVVTGTPEIVLILNL